LFLDSTRNLKWPDGRVYEGELENDNRHGKGTIKEPDGHKYEGEV
jgi:hypothetical protein